LELHKDSIFTLDEKRQKNQLSLSGKLYKNFADEVSEMRLILEEYHHLLVHDNFDCSTHMQGKNFMFKCWFKRYGSPLLCLVVFTLGSYLYVMRELRKFQGNMKIRSD
jgi:hypothetical protein